MALVRLKRAAQITLPAELRRRFNLEEGDYLEAEAVEGGILLKPVAVMDRSQARRELRELLDRVHATLPPQGTLPAPPPNSLILEVGAEGDASIGQGADGSLRNIGPEEHTIYALTISPAGTAASTPTP